MERETDKQERPKKKSGRWKVGESGNPDGLAPWAWHEVVRSVAMQQRQDRKENRLAAAEALFDEAVEKRNVAAIKEIGDRLDGKALQKEDINLSGNITLSQIYDEAIES